MRARVIKGWFLALGVLLVGRLEGSGVLEGEQDIPLVQDVDVVVVGGTVGGVAAAVAAAEAGAKVFLTASRPYLGEDMAGKLRLRLTGGEGVESDLIKRIFFDDVAQLPQSVPFGYHSQGKEGSAHRDANGVMLCDGKWANAASESVQFDSDATIQMNFGAVVELQQLSVALFYREGKGGFATRSISVAGSIDKRSWVELGKVAEFLQENKVGESVIMSLPITGAYKFLKVEAELDPAYQRQLLGELIAVPAVITRQDSALAETTPLQIKKALDKALLEAGVQFLTGTQATEPLFDEKDKLAGVIMANRSGRQAVKAKVVIDATERGLLARSAGAEATDFPAGTYTFKRTLIAGEAPQADGVSVRELLGVHPVHITGIKPANSDLTVITGRVYECSVNLHMPDGSERAFAAAEQKVRDLTFVPTQLDSANTMEFVQPDHIECLASLRTPWEGAEKLDIRAFQPTGVDYLYLLSGVADISRHAAELLAAPGNLVVVGTRIGKAAAQTATQRAQIGRVSNRGTSSKVATKAQLLEHNKTLPGYLCNTQGSIKSTAQELPLLAECDVVVVGAGTGGGPAGIAAARHGARTIVCEYLYEMGGVQTEGLIGKYWYGNRVGFTREIDSGVVEKGAVFSQAKSEWYRSQNNKDGAEVWYGTMATGVVVENNVLQGVVVVTPGGKRGVIRCKVAIDGTGNAELPAMAGEPTEFITADELAVQGAGYSRKDMGASYNNNDISFVDDTDAADLFYFALRSRHSIPAGTWDQAQLPTSRERRRMIGAFYISPLDVVNQRTYDDIVVQTRSNFDTHGMTVHEQFFIEDPGHGAMMVNLPYRSLLPQKLEGVLVVGLGISAHRDAMPILRMQPDVQNQGYAAGTAAAMAVKAGVAPRNIDIKALQRKMVERGIIPEEVLKLKDSFPLSMDLIEKAVKTLPKNYEGLGVVMVDPQRSIPLMQRALQSAATPDERLVYAHVLGMMGLADGEAELINKITTAKWDEGWNFRGMGQMGRSVSWIDSYIIALGRIRSQKAVPAIIRKAQELSVASEFSHFRAVAMALEQIGNQSAAPVLAGLLAMEGIGNHTTVMGAELLPIKNYSGRYGDVQRSEMLLELSLARALYRLGDHNNIGKRTLEAFVADPRRAYANHAKLVLGLD